MTRSQATKAGDKSRHRWPRKGLAAILFLMPLVCIGMSLVAMRMRTARRQRDAVAAIEKSGGSAWYYPDAPCQRLWLL